MLWVSNALGIAGFVLVLLSAIVGVVVPAAVMPMLYSAVGAIAASGVVLLTALATGRE